jgi:molybdate/tungstate transport system substrate-binding protein
MARLQGGQIDAASAYATQPPPLNLPSIRLPAAINLGDPADAANYDRASVTIDGKTLRPSPLVFYGAALNAAKNPALARRFIHWLRSPAVARIFQRYHYDLPDGAAPLFA